MATPLSDQGQYFMDSAAECGDVSTGCYNAISLWGAPERIDAIISVSRAAGGRWRRGLCAIGLELEDYALELARAHPIEVQRSLVATAIIGMKYRIKENAEWLAGAHFEDSTTGGELRPYKSVSTRQYSTFEPTKRDARRLRAPAAIVRYVDAEDQSVPHAGKQAQRILSLPQPDSLEETRIVLELLRAAHDEIRAKHQRGLREAEIRCFGERMFDEKLPYRIVKQELHKKRRAIVKAASIVAAVLGASAVSAFAAGHPVEIRGEQMILEARPKGGVFAIGHGAFGVTLKSLEGVELGNLCVYFDKTPALDQLAAFAMHMAAGEDAAILETGNLFGVTAAGVDHPLLKGRVKPQANIADIIAPGGRWRGAARQAILRARQEAHYAEMGHVYRERIETLVWGRAVKRYRILSRAGA